MNKYVWALLGIVALIAILDSFSGIEEYTSLPDEPKERVESLGETDRFKAVQVELDSDDTIRVCRNELSMEFKGRNIQVDIVNQRDACINKVENAEILFEVDNLDPGMNKVIMHFPSKDDYVEVDGGTRSSGSIFTVVIVVIIIIVIVTMMSTTSRIR